MIDSRVCAKPTGPSAVDALIVRAAMGEGARHGLEQRRLRPLPVFQHESSDAAHRGCPDALRSGAGSCWRHIGMQAAAGNTE
jgi:hypothetical protein